jgi:hypothetical protein
MSPISTSRANAASPSTIGRLDADDDPVGAGAPKG